MVECELGYSKDGNECVRGPYGTYSDTLDSDSCTSCPEGHTTIIDRAHSADVCFGKEDTFLFLIFI